MMKTIWFGVLLAVWFSKVESLENAENKRNKRTLLFPASSTIGILAAVAVPLNIPHRNVFMSYNFEANYNSPYLATDFIPGPLTRLDLVKKREIKENNIFTKNLHQEPSLLSRRKAYYILEQKFEHIGFKGKSCLLRTICESNFEKIGFHNGVIGDIFHIIFSPSSSKDENLPQEYYDAEFNGINKQCDMYYKSCSRGILEIISKLL